MKDDPEIPFGWECFEFANESDLEKFCVAVDDADTELATQIVDSGYATMFQAEN